MPKRTRRISIEAKVYESIRETRQMIKTNSIFNVELFAKNKENIRNMANKANIEWENEERQDSKHTELSKN